MFQSTWLLWEIASQGEALVPASCKKSAGALASPGSPGPFLYGTKVGNGFSAWPALLSGSVQEDL